MYFVNEQALVTKKTSSDLFPFLIGKHRRVRDIEKENDALLAFTSNEGEFISSESEHFASFSDEF